MKNRAKKKYIFKNLQLFLLLPLRYIKFQVIQI